MTLETLEMKREELTARVQELDEADVEELLRLVRQMSGSHDSDETPRDEWERGLDSLMFDEGISLPDHALSSEGLYD